MEAGGEQTIKMEAGKVGGERWEREREEGCGDKAGIEDEAWSLQSWWEAMGAGGRWKVRRSLGEVVSGGCGIVWKVKQRVTMASGKR